MSNTSVILVTGSTTGFGRLTVETLKGIIHTSVGQNWLADTGML